MSKIVDDTDVDSVPDFDVPRAATTLSPEKPNDEQKKQPRRQKINNLIECNITFIFQMKSHAEKILNDKKEYTAYSVDWYINNGDVYCFRVRSYHLSSSLYVVLTGLC